MWQHFVVETRSICVSAVNWGIITANINCYS